MLNWNRTREARDRHGDNSHLTKADSAAINLTPRARPGSALPGRARGDDRSATHKGRLAPGRAGLVTPRRRHSTREAGEAPPSSVPAKEQTAGCGWFPWEESARSARA
jgi:hypothetical protein